MLFKPSKQEVAASSSGDATTLIDQSVTLAAGRQSRIPTNGCLPLRRGNQVVGCWVPN